MANQIIFLSIFVITLLVHSAIATKWHEPSYTRHEMKPRKKDEINVAYTQDDLYFSEFKHYVEETHLHKHNKWVKKYPIIGIASYYYTTTDLKISKKTFKQYFLDATLDYYLRLPFKLGILDLKQIVDLYRTRIWEWYDHSKLDFHAKKEFSLLEAFE